ncbi:MAG: hypothetical protein A2144_13170 [Chloroflexi bacterium RBG_16_50_9]|nr:MAG: hypothetical protein A2144_13170 [Chloroflexi bacterium RBG_16_50_9]
MEFFGMGLGEILLILVIVLVIWGPGKIVDAGRTMGKLARNFKKATADLTTQITSETEEKKGNSTSKQIQPLGEQEHK